jgi:hypothetical protein
MESSQVGSVGQSVNQSINQPINQSINPLPCTADPADNQIRSDQIQLNSTQLNSTQIKPDQVREPCCRVSSDIETRRGGVGVCGAAMQMRCDALLPQPPTISILCLLAACLLACWLAS